MARYIDADELESKLFRDGIAGIFLNYPRRIKFTIGEIRGMLKNERIAPTADVVPRAELEHILSDLKKEIHDKAVYPHKCGIEPYISLKKVDAVIQKYVEKVRGEKNG